MDNPYEIGPDGYPVNNPIWQKLARERMELDEASGKRKRFIEFRKQLAESWYKLNRKRYVRK